VDLGANQIRKWHRRLCEVTPWLTISGDLHPDRELAALQLNEWVECGITDIVDVRGEWSDEDFVSAHAPGIRYHHLGTHDDGGSQDESWFEAGLEILRNATSHPGARLIVHCHMGINRGPSMAFAMMLAQGWEPVPALDEIRTARPIAGIIYAEDALKYVRQIAGNNQHEEGLLSVQQWFDQNYIDVTTIIRHIRASE